jgi:hypothetical protein
MQMRSDIYFVFPDTSPTTSPSLISQNFGQKKREKLGKIFKMIRNHQVPPAGLAAVEQIKHLSAAKRLPIGETGPRDRLLQLS